MCLRKLAAISVRFGDRRLTVVATGRLARECQANVSVVHGGQSDGEDEEAGESGSAAPSPVGNRDRAEPAVEYGFHERASEWRMADGFGS